MQRYCRAPWGPVLTLAAEQVADSDDDGVIHGHLLGPRPWLSPLPCIPWNILRRKNSSGRVPVLGPVGELLVLSGFPGLSGLHCVLLSWLGPITRRWGSLGPS